MDNLVTHFPGNREPTLRDVDLTVHEGEIMVIMGGSGSGKTTLLRHMIGLDTPTSGGVKILGRDITKLNAGEMYHMRKSMGVSFQGGAMFNSMTVGENLKLPLREHTKLAEPQMEIMTRMKLAFVNLAVRLLDDRPTFDQLSAKARDLQRSRGWDRVAQDFEGFLA